MPDCPGCGELRILKQCSEELDEELVRSCCLVVTAMLASPVHGTCEDPWTPAVRRLPEPGA
jgi:hypothetical protein